MTSLHRPVLLLAILLCSCTAQTGYEPVGHTSLASTVCATGTVVQGIDVSVYQGSINWSDVKAAGIDFAIARISDGSSLDSYFSANWTGMKSAGLVRGAYQYFEPGDDPTTQANIVISAVGKLGAGDLPVTADMETTGGESAATIAANLKTWVSAVQTGTGKLPMIYTGEGYWDGDVASSSFSSDPLWVANWGVSCPDIPTGWSQWSIWQYSDSGTVSGISGAVDLDEYNGTLAQLQAFAGGSTSSDGGTAGIYGAEYVTQSWPLASTTMTMTTCQTIAESITLKNVGTKSWDSKTRIGTTQSRDRVSVFADSTWISTDRPAQVSGTVAPGDTFEFKFDFHAPPTTGTYTEYFGVVEDGVVWFSDPGQDGPPDNDIEAKIQVTAGSTSCTADPGFVDGGKAKHDSGAESNEDGSTPPVTLDSGTTGVDAGAPVGPTFRPDAGRGSHAKDAGLDANVAADTGASSEGNSGCSCDAAGAGRGPAAATWALGFVAVIMAGRRRRSRGRRGDWKIASLVVAAASVCVACGSGGGGSAPGNDATTGHERDPRSQGRHGCPQDRRRRRHPARRRRRGGDARDPAAQPDAQRDRTRRDDPVQGGPRDGDHDGSVVGQRRRPRHHRRQGTLHGVRCGRRPGRHHRDRLGPDGNDHPHGEPQAHREPRQGQQVEPGAARCGREARRRRRHGVRLALSVRQDGLPARRPGPHDAVRRHGLRRGHGPRDLPGARLHRLLRRRDAGSRPVHERRLDRHHRVRQRVRRREGAGDEALFWRRERTHRRDLDDRAGTARRLDLLQLLQLDHREQHGRGPQAAAGRGGADRRHPDEPERPVPRVPLGERERDHPGGRQRDS